MKEKIGSILMLIVFILAGLIMAYFLRNSEFQNTSGESALVEIETFYNYEIQVENLKTENEMLQEQVDELNQTIDEYQNVDSETSLEYIIGKLKEEKEQLLIFNGGIAVEGPGITITLEDADEEDIPDGANPNNYLVHNTDILQLVNELKIGGAEAIQLNGIRITAYSTINCGGPVINVDGQVSSPPFVLEAIGNQKDMLDMLNSSESILQVLQYWKINVNIEETEYIVVNENRR
jgi:uncharacterized protein YlxW (UPF0749 family)